METKIQTFRGKDFTVIKGNIHPMYSFHTFELEEHDLRDKYWNIKPNDIVFDVGASYGSYSLTACVSGATVYAFEPEPSVFVDLVKNIEINKWQDRCFPMNIALSNNNEVINMKEYAPHWPQQTISGLYKSTTLDQVAKQNKISHLDWIKIDVEGVEENVIKGAVSSINYFHPKLLIECHNFMDKEISNRVKAMLPNYIFEEIERGNCITLFGTSK